MQSNPRQPEGLTHDLEEFIEANQAEVTRRYNLLLEEIKQAKGKGILSIHNRHFGSKGLYFAGAVQYLYRLNQGQPLPEETPITISQKSATQTKSNTVEDITTPANQAASKASQPTPSPQAEGDDDDDDNNDASNFISRHAS